jgi:hypothetical protein
MQGLTAAEEIGEMKLYPWRMSESFGVSATTDDGLRDIRRHPNQWYLGYYRTYPLVYIVSITKKTRIFSRYQEKSGQFPIYRQYHPPPTL